MIRCRIYDCKCGKLSIYYDYLVLINAWRDLSCSLLTLVQPTGSGGARSYLAVSGGLDVPVYLGSRATFPGGKLGGVQVWFRCPPSRVPEGNVVCGFSQKCAHIRLW